MPSSRTARLALVGLAAVGVVVALQPEAVRAGFERLVRFIELAGEPVLASTPVISEHEIEELRAAPAQEQAERLLERAINGYRGANELIEAELASWHGEIAMQGRLDGLFRVALDSSNLRVRAAAIEIYLAAFAVEKTPGYVAFLQQSVRASAAESTWHLWVLGFLANRGVERAAILEFLIPYLDDPDEEVRSWAVEGLAFSGDERVIPHLLRVFQSDPSRRVRERAACGLAQSGMLPNHARRRAVPELLGFADDPGLDPETRLWVYQALRDITGQSLPDDAAAWREWWG